ncbi:hypothetical protein [Nocardia ignorata]|uniref:Uncharacterized protein n=1 Tax=Nocardia ignorata TaxID=145285 RepID=A0A4R6P1T7_NOCIG|nr:hypothetical protein [Nocardia ignorata]TDP31156.1 hypothetical protein DFR75_109125 [Nocardia ignorata]
MTKPRHELREVAKSGPLTLLTASRLVDMSEATVLADILDGKQTP